IDPGARWPSMAPQLAALAHGIAPRRWPALALATAAIAGAVVLARSPESTPPPAPCVGADAAIDQTWNDDARAALRAALTDTAGGAEALARTEGVLDAYAASWRASAVAACEATRVAGHQSDTVLDLRVACLERRRGELAQTLRLVDQGTPQVRARAAGLVAALPRIAACDDVVALQTELPPPDDPQRAADVAALRERLAHVAAMVRAADHAGAAAEADAIVSDAEAVAYPPVLAEALLQRATIRDLQAKRADARGDLDRVWLLAVELGHHAVETEAAIRLAFSIGVRDRDVDAGLQWAATALALARRTGTDALLLAMAHDTHASVLELAERRREAVAEAELALALREGELGPDHVAIASSLANVAMLRWKTDEGAQAIEQLQRAIAMQQRVTGALHPDVALLQQRLAVVLSGDGRYEEALDQLRAAAGIVDATVGEQSTVAARIHTSMGRALHELGRIDEALDHLRRAVAIFEALLGPEHPELGPALNALAVALPERGLYEEALTVSRRVLGMRERTEPPDSPGLAVAHAAVGGMLRQLGRLDEARRELEQAIASFERGGGSSAPGLMVPMLDLAEIELAQGRIPEARAAAERALALRGEATIPGTDAEYRFVLARVLWHDRSQRGRARALAEAAVRGYADAGPREQAARERVEAWLAQHRR
ncbi:MAG: tetratricopeptide repeat protein, partial [Nannocystaceae bacterium]|nr:tetratricopeptide repeat protein [Nannocystaceae bacterium]